MYSPFICPPATSCNFLSHIRLEIITANAIWVFFETFVFTIVILPNLLRIISVEKFIVFLGTKFLSGKEEDKEFS